VSPFTRQNLVNDEDDEEEKYGDDFEKDPYEEQSDTPS